MKLFERLEYKTLTATFEAQLSWVAHWSIIAPGNIVTVIIYFTGLKAYLSGTICRMYLLFHLKMTVDFISLVAKPHQW